MRIDHITRALGCSILACLGLAAAAAASPTDSDAGMAHRTYVANQPFDLNPAVCGFPVHVGFPADNEYVVQSSTAPDGTTTLRITGHLVETFTNTSNGNSLTENLSGPVTLTLAPDGSIEALDGQGGGVIFFGPHSQATFGVPGIDIIHGHVLQQFNALGQTSALSISGAQTDGCALIG